MTRRITVRARPVRTGREPGRPEPAVEFVLGHGADVLDQLAVRGWRTVQVAAVTSVGCDGDDLLIEVLVERAAPSRRLDVTGPASDADVPVRASTVPADSSDTGVLPWAPGLVVAPEEVAHVHQRVAAYALVTHDRRLLLTRISSRVPGAGGRWTLPGGGLDPGESPHEALLREVWEETGHEVDEVQLLDVHTAHWLGRSPRGRLEDFHAIRLLHRARTQEPRPPVVHDVGGSTDRAAWVPLDRVGRLPLAPLVRHAWQRWVVSAAAGSDEAHGADDRDDQAGPDDEVGPAG